MRAYLLSLALGLLLLAGCTKQPDFPDAPVIRFESLNLYPNPSPNLDSLVVSVHFTDGNGDLGLTEFDRKTNANYVPFPNIKDSTALNLRTYNFLLTVFAENQFGGFDSIRPQYGTIKRDNPTPGAQYIQSLSRYGAFAPTQDMQKDEPLEGYISFTAHDFLVALTGATPVENRGRIYKGKHYYAVVRIVDRAGNFSNKVSSDTLTY